MCITQKFYTSIVKKIPSVLNASCAQLLSHICLFATPWIIACQAPLSMEFSRQEYWSGLSFPSPARLPDPWIKPTSHALAGGFFTTSATWEAHSYESKSESRSVVSDSLRLHELYSPWNSPGQNTGIGSHSLLRGIFPTQGSNLGVPHCRQILYQLSHKGSLE